MPSQRPGASITITPSTQAHPNHPSPPNNSERRHRFLYGFMLGGLSAFSCVFKLLLCVRSGREDERVRVTGICTCARQKTVLVALLLVYVGEASYANRSVYGAHTLTLQNPPKSFTVIIWQPEGRISAHVSIGTTSASQVSLCLHLSIIYSLIRFFLSFFFYKHPTTWLLAHENPSTHTYM